MQFATPWPEIVPPWMGANPALFNGIGCVMETCFSMKGMRMPPIMCPRSTVAFVFSPVIPADTTGEPLTSVSHILLGARERSSVRVTAIGRMLETRYFISRSPFMVVLC